MNKTVTYQVVSIVAAQNGCYLSESGNTVTVHPGFDPIAYGIQAGDLLLVETASDSRYLGLQTITAVAFGQAQFASSHTGLPRASGAVQFSVAEVVPYYQLPFVPGVPVTITGDSNPAFNGPTTIRATAPSGNLTISFPLGSTPTPYGDGGTITGVIALPDVVTPPAITAFTAAPTSILAGATSTLTWTTTNADSCLLYPAGQSPTIVAPNGSLAVTPGATTLYTLVAINSASQVTASLTVTVTDGPTVTLTASPLSINSGSSSTLTWSTANAVAALISPTVGSVSLSGSASVSPTVTTAYVITATGSTGAQVTASTTVTVVPPPPPPGPLPPPPKPPPTPPKTPVTTVPFVHFMSCTYSSNAAAYIGDLLGQYPPYDLLSSTRTGYAKDLLDLNGASGTNLGSNVSADMVVKDDEGNLYFGLLVAGETTFHFTKIQVVPPGILSPLDRSNWTATATHDNGAAYAASKVLDGNRGSYWWSGAAVPQTLTVDMGLSYYADFLGIDPGTAHSSDNPTSVTITVDGVPLGTFSLSTNPVESFVPVHTMGRVWALQFTAVNGGSWCEVAEVRAYTGTGTPNPTFIRIASGDITVPNAFGGRFGAWFAYDKTVIRGHAGAFYKLNSTDLTLIASGVLGGGTFWNLVGTVDTGQVWVRGSGNDLQLTAAAESDITITGVSVSGGNAVYAYSGVTGPVLQLGMPVTVTGFPTSGNNVTAKPITALGSGTFTVATTTQVNETAVAAGVVPFASTIRIVNLSAFSITGSLDGAFLDPGSNNLAWLVVNGSTQEQLYHVNLDTLAVLAGPGALPAHNSNWSIVLDPTQPRFYATDGGATLYLIDTTTFAATVIGLPTTPNGNLVPDPAITPTGIGYQTNTAISFVQGAQSGVFPGSVTSGNTLIVTFSSLGSVSSLTVTDTLGTSYAPAYISVGQPINIAVYFGIAPSSGANTVSVTGAAGIQAQIAEVVGAHAVNDVTPFAQYGTYGFSSNFTANLTINTSTDWDMLLVVAAKQESFNLSGFSTPTPYTFPLWNIDGMLGWLAAGKAGNYSLSTGFHSNGSGKAGAVILALTPITPTVVDVGGAVYYPTYVLNNLTNGARNPDFLVDDEFQIVVAGAAPNAQVDIIVNGTWTLNFGTTDGSGGFTYSSTFAARPHPGNYYQLNVQNFSALRVSGFLTNTKTYTVSETGTPIPLSGIVLTMTNLTDPGRYPTFVFTDAYRLSLTGAPINSRVDIVVNGGVTEGFGTTDGSGNFSYQGTWNDGILDVLYVSQNPYNSVYFVVNGLFSTAVVFRVQFSLDGLVWIQGPGDLSFCALWYGIDPLNGRVAQTMGVQPGNSSGSLSANAALVYSIPGAFPLVAPEGLIGPVVVHFTTGPSSATSSGGIVPVAGGDDTQATILLPAFNAGDRRAQKMFGDLFAEAAVATGTVMIVSLWQNQYENAVATYSPSVLTPLNGGLRSPYIINLSSDGLQTTDIEAIIAWPVGPTTSLVTWQPSVIPQPESVQSRPSDWDSAGTPGNKFVQGMMVEFDSFGVGKTFGVQRSDDLAVFVPVECPATSLGQRTQSFTFVPPFLAHDMRIVSGDGVPWRTYAVKWIFQPYPEQSVNWQTEMVSFGTGWQSILFINLPHISTSDITLTLTFDQGPVSSITVVVPNSGGQFIKSKVTLGFNKFKLVSCRVFSVEKCTIFEREVEVWFKTWGSDGPFAPVRPFGGPSSPGAAV